MSLMVAKGVHKALHTGSGRLRGLLQQRHHDTVCVCKDQIQPEFCMLIYVDFSNLLRKSFSVKVLQPKVISMI